MISIDIATLVAVIVGVFAIFGLNLTLFLWLRSEGNSDRRHFQDLQKEDRKDILQMISAIKEEVSAIRNETKDFHYRLLEIERQKIGGK